MSTYKYFYSSSGDLDLLYAESL